MKKSLIALTTSLALIFVASNATWADYVQKYSKKGSGYVRYVYYDDKGKAKSWHLYTEAGKHVESGSYSNPNPAGGSRGTGDPKSSFKDKEVLLLQKGGGKLFASRKFANTPLGKFLSNKGGGLGTVYQPGPNGPESGPSAPQGKNPFKGKDLIPKNNIGGVIGGILFNFNSGGHKGFVSKNKGKKGSKGGGGSPDKKVGAANGAFGDLPGPPELVNPNPGSRK